MIFYENNTSIFNFRVAAIIYNSNKDKILIHKSKDGKHWVLPGGRVEFYEQAEDAIRRELFEEIGIRVQECRLVWMVENFFTKDEKKFHEISLYYFIELLQENNLEENDEFYGIEYEKNILFSWKKIDELSEYVVYPQFLKTSLKNIPFNVKHIVNLQN